MSGWNHKTLSSSDAWATVETWRLNMAFFCPFIELKTHVDFSVPFYARKAH